MKTLFTFLLMLFGSPLWAQTPLVHGHAHNDYEHKRPLFDALDHGFCSIEADIWLVDGKLLVAHDRKNVTPERTLQALYLDPLRDRVRKNGGRVYPKGPSVTLLVELKSSAEETYPALREALKPYQALLTEFRPNSAKVRAITVIVTGNSPKSQMATEPLRYAAADGSLEDLEANTSKYLVPLISADWMENFRWLGLLGDFTEGDRLKLKGYAAKAHQQGRRLRFWGTPNNLNLWREERADGVDLINADDLDRAQKFLLEDQKTK